MKLNSFISYSFLILFSLYTFGRFSEDEYNIVFNVYGMFYISIFYLIFSLINSAQFRIFFKTRLNIFCLFALTTATINGFLNNNDSYWIKEDLFRIILVYCGISTVFLWSKKYIMDKNSPLYLITTFYLISIFVKHFNHGFSEIFTERYTSYTTIAFSFMIIPLSFFNLVKNKILGKPNKKLMIMIFFIFFYETFISVLRTNILSIFIGILMYLGINKSKNKPSLDFILKAFFLIIIIFSITPFLFLINSSYLDRPFSNYYRLYEAGWVFQNYIINEPLFGFGLGKTYTAPDTGDLIRNNIHIGLFTILLKFGFLGLVFLFYLISKYILKYLAFSGSREKFFSEKQLFIATPITIWFIIFTLSTGSHPEQMLMLGLIIGSYLELNNLLEYLNNNS